MELGRRAFLAASGAMGLLAVLPARAVSAGRGRYLTHAEMDTLRAVTDTLVPGPPIDRDPGALQAHCAEAIDLLLAAFSFDPPLIHAGGPFSGRAPVGPTGHHDDFAEFVALDPLAELGWRLRIEGSRGKREREFAGPVRGLQEIYRSGLALVDARARTLGARGFAELSPAARLALLSNPADTDVQAFVGTALANTLDAMYGPPEYGGNHGLAGWTPLGWPGDAQPRGFTDREVTEPDPNSGVDAATAERSMQAIRKFLVA
ncbi:MAG: gluconate 2-dehydrogenase subunit 3 family protein [Acidimicrobiales bacterium]